MLHYRHFALSVQVDRMVARAIARSLNHSIARSIGRSGAQSVNCSTEQFVVHRFNSDEVRSSLVGSKLFNFTAHKTKMD